MSAIAFRIATATPFSAQKFADAALRAATRFWFVTAVAGQLLFAFAIASFYGLTAARGDWQAWNRRMMHGHAAGDGAGNFVVAMHLLSAVVIILAGALQFVPQVRDRFPAVHRWIGRMYMLSAFTLTTAGLFMQWMRESFGDLWLRIGATLNVVLIWVCAAMALRYAISRDFKAHRRWALRLFLVVSAAWLFRIGFYLSLLVFQGPFGFDPTTFKGPFLTFMGFAQWAVPLVVLELYFLAQARPGAVRRIAMASTLFVLTLAMGAGIFAVSAFVWVPSIQAAFDSRISIARTLSVTIESSGIDAGVRQYRDLKAAKPAAYNFDERELNSLGYQLVRAKKLPDAIRIFELNAEAYPKSSNAWDSLGEACLSAGKKAEAIAHYRKALQLNPKNRSAAASLHRLGAL